MSGFELRVNVYDHGKVGHVNISFYQNEEHVYTIGANVRMEVPQLAIPQVLPFEPDDGIIRDETAYHAQAVQTGSVKSASVPVTKLEYGHLLSTARALEGETFNYSVFTEACIELVDGFYKATGHPGEFGDLFAEDQRTGSLVWSRVPISDDNPFSVWPDDQPHYTPPEPVMPDPPPFPKQPSPVVFSAMPDPPLPGPTSNLPIAPKLNLTFAANETADVTADTTESESFAHGHKPGSKIVPMQDDTSRSEQPANSHDRAVTGYLDEFGRSAAREAFRLEASADSFEFQESDPDTDLRFGDGLESYGPNDIDTIGCDQMGSPVDLDPSDSMQRTEYDHTYDEVVGVL